MKTTRYNLCALLWLCFLWLPGKALVVTDNTEISVLTCSPGNELYSLFGHTAIRVECPENGVDVVFNYGTFDFHTEHFYLKYARGLLPYQLSVASYDSFIRSYVFDNRSVRSQRLLLDAAQKQRLVDLLAENYQPANRTYLYNFLYDNCSTRVRDIIEACAGNAIQWHVPDAHKSFWNLLDEYLVRMPWVKWGIHTILGQRGNRTATPYQYMFLPDYLLEGLEHATLNGTRLAAPVQPLFEAEEEAPANPWYGSPLFVFSVAAVAVVCLLRRFRSRRLLASVAFPLFLLSGLIGCLLVFLGRFTQHPMTAPNYNLIWANPLNLLVLPWLWRSQLPRGVKKYLTLYVWILTLGLPMWFFLQPSVPYASIPLLVLMIYLSRRLKQKPHSSNMK